MILDHLSRSGSSSPYTQIQSSWPFIQIKLILTIHSDFITSLHSNPGRFQSFIQIWDLIWGSYSNYYSIATCTHKSNSERIEEEEAVTASHRWASPPIPSSKPNHWKGKGIPSFFGEYSWDIHNIHQLVSLIYWVVIVELDPSLSSFSDRQWALKRSKGFSYSFKKLRSTSLSLNSTLNSSDQSFGQILCRPPNDFSISSLNTNQSWAWGYPSLICEIHSRWVFLVLEIEF